MYVFLFQFTSLLGGGAHHAAIVVKIHADLINAIFLPLLIPVLTNFARPPRKFLCAVFIVYHTLWKRIWDRKIQTSILAFHTFCFFCCPELSLMS